MAVPWLEGTTVPLQPCVCSVSDRSAAWPGSTPPSIKPTRRASVFCPSPPDGSPDPGFPFNRADNDGAQILVAGRNFGCGSSREHAPWALLDLGLRAVISSQIADIFRSNALKNGLLPVVLDEAIVEELLAQPGIELAIDIATRTLALPDGRRFGFPLDAFAQACLLEGVDQLGYLLARHPAIQRFEAARDAAGAA